MSRGLTASMQAEVAKSEIRPAFFLELEFPSATLRYWTGYGSISWDSKTWSGSGDVIKIGGIDETAAVEANGIQFQLDATDPAVVSLAMTEDVQGRPVRVWIGMISAPGATGAAIQAENGLDIQTESGATLEQEGAAPAPAGVIADPVGPFEYLADQIVIDEQLPAATITLTAESYLASLERPRPRRLTHEDQQIEFPGDLGLEFVAGIQNKTIPWGQP